MNEFRVGILTAISLICLGIISLKITANKSAFGDYTTYKTVVDDASGLFARTPIKIAGINAGNIKEIKLKNNQALIEFEILDKIKLTDESILRIKTVGFLGDKYIDVYLGTGNGARLEEGSYVKSNAGGGIEDLARDASDVMGDVKGILKKLNESMLTDDNKNVLKEILANVHKATESIKRITVENEDKINKVVESVNQLTQQLAFETDASQRQSLMADLKKIGPIMDEFQLVSSDLKVILADVRAGKGTVGKLLRDEQVIDKVSETLSGVNRIVNRINNIEADIALFSGFNEKNDSGKTELDIDLYFSPEKLLKFGVVNSSFGPMVEEESTTTSKVNGGNPTIENKVVQDNNAFKFNIQIGRKFSQFALRAGLFESKGGFGLDYYIKNHSWRFTLEAFDFERDDGTNLRLATEFRIWNVVYSRLAGEDLLTDKRSFTASAGLRFTDQDLASLIGLAVR